MSLKCGSVNLTKGVTLLSNASTLSFSSLGGRVALALLCLLAPTVVLQAWGPPPPPPDCPSCTIDVTPTGPLASGTVSEDDPTAPGWSVQYWVDASKNSPSYPSETQAEKPRNNRGLALSPTNQFLYAGYNTGHPDGTNGEVRKIDTTKTDPLDQTAVVAFLLGFRGKAIAVDDKGRVYLAEGFHENNDTGDPDLANRLVIYDSSLATQHFSFGVCVGTNRNNCLPAPARPEGVAVVRFDATHLTLYVSDRDLGMLYEFILTESGSGISSALFEDEYSVSGAVSLRGVEVDKSGRIWIADPEAGKVFIVENTLMSNSFALVDTAMDVGFDKVNAFVTQGPNPSGSTITVLSQTSPFAPVTMLTPPYASLNINPTVNGGGDEPRLSGIAVACPLFGCTTPGFYVANEGAWETAPDLAEVPPQFNREPIIRANAGTVTPCPQACGKVTGGGQIEVASSGSPRRAKYANYGFNVQVKNGKVKGQLEYLDHSTGANYHSVKMTSLTVSPDFKTADFTGTIKKKGDPTIYTFSVHIEDHGEPGSHKDKFRITINSTPVYTAGFTGGMPPGTVDKGNIQIHRNCKQVDEDHDHDSDN